MTTLQVADRFNELAKQGEWKTIQEELYADDAESIEPEHAAAMGMVNVKGKDAIIQKGDEFNSMIEEMHGGYSSDPVVAGNYFSVAMGMDITMKGQPRMNMDEIAVYKVEDGKIVSEQFFF